MEDNRNPTGPTVHFKYKNHNGKIAERTVIVESLEYIIDPGFGYPPGWFLSGYCYDKKARRSFALGNIILPEDEARKFFTLLKL